MYNFSIYCLSTSKDNFSCTTLSEETSAVQQLNMVRTFNDVKWDVSGVCRISSSSLL